MNYQRIYDQIIDRARSRKLEGYKEKHHIIPKCLQGDNSSDNMVELTAREHFVVHQLLVKIYPNEPKLKSALWFMCNQKGRGRNYKVSSRLYEYAKINHIENLTGTVRSEEVKKKISESKKGVPNFKNRGRKRPDLVENNIKRIGNKYPRKEGYISPKKGIPQSEELIEKRAESRKSNSKYIQQYTKDLQLIAEYRCLTDARSWLKLNVGHGDIIANLKGVTKTAGGYIWKYKN